MDSKEEWAKVSRRTRHQIWIKSLLEFNVTSPKGSDTDLNSYQSITKESLEAELQRLDRELEEVVLPEKYQRVILQDVERTRGEYSSFHTPEMQCWMGRAIALFLKEHDVEYMQGLNEILAPFLFVAADGAIHSARHQDYNHKKKPTAFKEKSVNAVSDGENTAFATTKVMNISSMASHQISGISTMLSLNINCGGSGGSKPTSAKSTITKYQAQHPSNPIPVKSQPISRGHSDENYPPDFVVKPSSLAYLLFSCFVNRFQPCMFTKNDEQISTLRCHLALLGQLVPYHDPELAIHLAETGMTPDLYATPWFVTLFARTTPIEVILSIWDHYLQEDYSPVHQFMVLAFILHHRQLLLSTHEEYVPETLTRLAWLNKSDAAIVWNKAQELMKQTPASYYTALEALCYDATTPPAIRAQIIQRLQAFSCLQIAASDVADSLLSFPSQTTYSSSSSWKRRRRVHGKTHCRFLLIDCRPESEVSSNYIKGVFRLDPNHLNTPQACPKYNGPYGELTHLIAQLQSMPEHVHFCLHGQSSRQMSAATAYAHLLLQRQFRHVGILHGGYPALVAELESRGWLPKNGVYILPEATGVERSLLSNPSVGLLASSSHQQQPKEIQERTDVPLWQRLAMPRFILSSTLSTCFANGLNAYTQMAKHFASTEYVRHTGPAKAMTKELKVTLQKLEEIRKDINLSVPSLADHLAGRC